jgi:hypothetical protein
VVEYMESHGFLTTFLSSNFHRMLDLLLPHTFQI